MLVFHSIGHACLFRLRQVAPNRMTKHGSPGTNVVCTPAMLILHCLEHATDSSPVVLEPLAT